MTVLTDTMKINYVGDGATVDYIYDFRIIRSDEALVKVDGVEISAFTISGLGNPGGGTITFATAPVDQSDILIQRDVNLTQLIDYRAYDPFPAETHETGLDRLVMMIQQINNQLLNVFATDIEGLETPPYVAGEYWRWDLAAQEIVTGVPVANTINSATDAEIIAGTETTDLTNSPAQLKLAVETHEQAIVNVATLPGTPDANTIYLVDE